MKNIFKTIFFGVMSVALLFVVSNFYVNNNQDVYASQEDSRVEKLIDLLNRTERIIGIIEERERSGEVVDKDILLLKIQLVDMRLKIKKILEELIEDISEKLWSLNIVSPKGGESWQAGRSYDITWNSIGVKNISLSVCGETPLLREKYTCWDLPGNRKIDASLGRYSWTIDQNSPWIPGDVSIKITDIETGRYTYSKNFKVREVITDEGKNLLECRLELLAAQINAKDRSCWFLASGITLECNGVLTHTTNNNCIIESLKSSGWSVVSTNQQPYISSVSPRTGAVGDTVTIYGRNLIGTVPSGIGVEFLQNNRSIGVVDKNDIIREDSSGQLLQFRLGKLIVSSFSWDRYREIERGIYQLRIWNDEGKSNTVNFEVTGKKETIPTLDFRINGSSNNFVNVNRGEEVMMDWTSQGTTACEAKGTLWQAKNLDRNGTWIFPEGFTNSGDIVITCRGANTSASVTRTVRLIIMDSAQGSLSCAGAGEIGLDLNFSFSNTGSGVTLFRDNQEIESWHNFGPSGHSGVTTSGDLTPNTSYTYRLVNGTRTTSPELARVSCRTVPSQISVIRCSTSTTNSIAIEFDNTSLVNKNVTVWRDNQHVTDVIGLYVNTIFDVGLRSGATYSYHVTDGRSLSNREIARITCRTQSDRLSMILEKLRASLTSL